MSARDLPLYLATGAATTTLGADCASAWIDCIIGQPVSFQAGVSAGATGTWTVEGTNSEDPTITVVPTESFSIAPDACAGLSMTMGCTLGAPFSKVRLKYTRTSGGATSTCIARYSLGARGIVIMSQEFAISSLMGPQALANLTLLSQRLTAGLVLYGSIGEGDPPSPAGLPENYVYFRVS